MERLGPSIFQLGLERSEMQHNVVEQGAGGVYYIIYVYCVYIHILYTCIYYIYIYCIHVCIYVYTETSFTYGPM